MQNHELNYTSLFEFSNSNPYKAIPSELEILFSNLNDLKNKYCFPSINNDIGNFIKFFTGIICPRVIFEMGSGYGHSAFWFMLGSENVQKLYLTEYRKDLEHEFDDLPWPSIWKDKMCYFQDDAFNVIKDIDHIDLALIDGGKSEYLNFLKAIEPKMNPGSIVLIDNSFWRGSFLDPALAKEHASAMRMAELHFYLREDTSVWDSLFIPYSDGLSVLRKK